MAEPEVKKRVYTRKFYAGVARPLALELCRVLNRGPNEAEAKREKAARLQAKAEREAAARS